MGTAFSNLHIKISPEITQAALQQYVLAALQEGKLEASLEPGEGLSLMAGVLDIQSSWLLLILPAEPLHFTVLEIVARIFTAQHGSIAIVSRRDSSNERVILYEAGKQLDTPGTESQVKCANDIIVATARRLGIPSSLTGVMQTDELDVRKRSVFHLWCEAH